MKKKAFKPKDITAYDPAAIEKKWQKKWEQSKIFKAADNSRLKKFYALIEFPYPSGDGLHVGHIRSNTAMDIIAHKRRREGYNVLYPIGWDAFGLPTENYAIKTGIQPAVVTKKNTDTFRRQLKALGFSFDWTREVNTTDPKYYRWTQWIFLQFLKKNLAYKKKMTINWCPKDLIGLANEEVIDGCCERCGTPVEKRDKEQWMMAITKYADRLDKDLDTVDFLEKIKQQQRNWIGRSEGVNFSCTIKDLNIKVEMYNSVPQTYRAETFTVIAAEHPLVEQLIRGTDNEKVIREFIAELKAKKARNEFNLDSDPIGMFTGRYIENYAGTGRDLPIWIASYVVADYGTGIVNASAHDERDYAFAKKYKIPLHEVVEPLATNAHGPDVVRPGTPFVEGNAVVCVIKHWSEDTYLCLSWKASDWKGFVVGGIENGEDPIEAGIREIREETGYQNIVLDKKLGGTVHAQFYHMVKKENRFAHFTPIQYKLTDGEQKEISEKEKSLHDLHWLTAAEVNAFMNRDDMRLIWERSQGIEKPIIKNGILLEPTEFKGREWAEVRKDIIDYLEAKGFAKRKVQYKLRDWIFSRQRYWGEPIPVIHCEACKNIKQKVLIIHGFESSSEGGWLPWMKSELEKQGFEVRVPTILTAAHPTVESWMHVLTPHIKDFGPHDIIIGHSLGSKAALHLINKTKKKIGHLYLVASAIGSLEERNWENLRREWKGSDVDALKKFWHTPVEYAAINKYVSRVNLILSDDDPVVPATTHKDIPQEWNYEVWSGFGHFKAKINERLRDTILQAKNSGIIPVPEKDLPVELPPVKNYAPTETGESPLAAIDSWVNVKCPACKGPAKRETDTMPNWAGSSWYYLRYTDPKNAKAFADPKKLNYWTPVDWYNGGMEHTTLHLLYSRFWHKFLYDLKLVPTAEPYHKRTSHGLILAAGGEKMSKSKGNVINPDSIVSAVGADSLRIYQMFMGPFDQAIIWNNDNIAGSRRFIERVWKLYSKVRSAGSFQGNILHKTIKKVTEDIEAMRFNTAISSLMIAVNELEKAESISPSDYEIILALLAPFAPHVTEELWLLMGHSESIHLSAWPQFDASKLTEETVTIVVQVNGKVRGSFTASSSASQEELKAKAQAVPEVAKWTEGKQLIKAIVVPGKLVNIVVT